MATGAPGARMSSEKWTEIACVVDQSGSMFKVKDDAIGGFNQFLEEQREVEGRANLTLTLFNHDYELVHDSSSLGEVDPLDEETYRPKGMTAMLDAVGATIDRIDEHMAAGDAGPDRVLVLILTDGKENASTEYEGGEVARKIAERDEDETWEFVFWGANIDARKVAESINIDSGNVSQFATTGDHVHSVFGEMSRMTQSFRKTGSLDDFDEFDEVDGFGDS